MATSKTPANKSTKTSASKPTKTPAKRPSKTKQQSSDNIVQHLDDIKKDIMSLKAKISKTKQSDLAKLSEDVKHKVSDSASDIMKSSADVLHKATKVVQFAALGALEGGKKALKEVKKPKPRAAAKRTAKKTPRKTKS